MNLVIDQGNTSSKIALFGDEAAPLVIYTTTDLSAAYLEKMVHHHHPEACILSSVATSDPSVSAYLEQQIPHFYLLDSMTPIPIGNAYHTPETLGADRIAAAAGAWFLKPGKPILIVDMKTNVRIVAATNLNMQEAINTNRFREDLYYRLNTVPITIPPLRDRPDDIFRLFRKFAADFAEKYRMPVITLTEEAKSLLVNYRWPGNIRQLKNITEQISIIEQQREISATVLQSYLPDFNSEKFPMLYTGHAADQRTFSSEREILYQVLFDMKKDMNELKVLVNDIMKKNKENGVMTSKDFDQFSSFLTTPTPPEASVKENRSAAPNIQDTEEYVEESYSLEDMEKEAIRKALERNAGKRKNAATELNISERTLYRKIKEYNLE